MLFDDKLPKSLWAEAMRTAINLINISLSAPLDRGVHGSNFTDWTSIHIRSTILRIINFQSNTIYGLVCKLKFLNSVQSTN